MLTVTIINSPSLSPIIRSLSLTHTHTHTHSHTHPFSPPPSLPSTLPFSISQRSSILIHQPVLVHIKMTTFSTNNHYYKTIPFQEACNVENPNPSPLSQQHTIIYPRLFSLSFPTLSTYVLTILQMHRVLLSYTPTLGNVRPHKRHIHVLPLSPLSLSLSLSFCLSVRQQGSPFEGYKSTIVLPRNWHGWERGNN